MESAPPKIQSSSGFLAEVAGAALMLVAASLFMLACVGVAMGWVSLTLLAGSGRLNIEGSLGQQIDLSLNAKGLPTVSAVFVLNDPETGLPLALMGAGALTDIRTGAAGGVAAKHMARKDSRSVGLVGCGRQAMTQLQALLALFPLDTVRVAGRDRVDAERFCKEAAPLMRKGGMLLPCDIREACSSDIVVTTTPARAPVVLNAWVRPGTHITAIGADAPGKQEIESSLLARARVIVDKKEQAFHSGEVNVPLSTGILKPEGIAGELGDVPAGRLEGLSVFARGGADDFAADEQVHAGEARVVAAAEEEVDVAALDGEGLGHGGAGRPVAAEVGVDEVLPAEAADGLLRVERAGGRLLAEGLARDGPLVVGAALEVLKDNGGPLACGRRRSRLAGAGRGRWWRGPRNRFSCPAKSRDRWPPA